MLEVRFLIASLLILTACAPTPSGSPIGESAAPQGGRPPITQRAVTLAITREPPALQPSIIAGPNGGDYVALGSAFLAYLTPDQQPRPYLAQVLPTLENGAWKVLPDGRMETTYALNPNATFHDGHPITARDFLFAHEVTGDPVVPAQSRNPVLRFAKLRAVDDHTLFIDWTAPYMWAGAVHAPDLNPEPQHLLEGIYHDDKEAFINGPHWRDQFVGSGPYKVERWDPGNEMLFRAHEGFVLGKPLVDEIRVKFIADPNTTVANMLSGSVDASFFVTIGFPQNQALEQAGWEGTTEYWRGNSRLLEFQQRDWGNFQRAALDVRVRRAMLHAIDRQGLVDGIFNGKTVVTHFFLDRSNPAFAAVDRTATKYEYDPQRAAALLQEAGWARGGDELARNAAGEALSMPFLAVIGDVENQETTVVMDNWKAVGISSEFIRLTSALTSDNEFRSKFSAVAYTRRGFGLSDMEWTTGNISTPERRWAGNNRIGYSNPVVDEMWPKALGTVDPKERDPLIVAALKAMTDDAVVTPTHLQPRVMAYRKGLTGPREPWADDRAMIWNIWEWHWS
jgi:peptide/nickel transport system substrate-binding protein